MSITLDLEPRVDASQSSGGSHERRERLMLVLVLTLALLAGGFHLSTIRSGHGWHDDFASYVSHARNIAEGRPYAETGYIYNPLNPVPGPRAYPPGLPVLLAPIYAASGLDLQPMKALMVVLLSVWLVLLFVLIRRRYPGWVALSVVGVVGFHPFLSSFKDNVLSDIPFALFVTLTLLLLDRAYAAAAHRRRAPVGQAALGGVGIYLAYSMRSVGLVLVLALLLYELFVHRRVSRFAIGSALVFGLLMSLQHLIVPGGNGYVDQLRIASPRLALVNLWRYLRSLEGLALNGYVTRAAAILFVALTVLALVGYVSRLGRDRITHAEVLMPIYIASIAVWPAFQSLRFLLPVIPFYFLYALIGTRALVRGRARQRIALACLGAVLAGSFLSVYARIDYAPLAEGVEAPDTVELFDFVRTSTDPASVFVVQRPKGFALYTDRSATPYDPLWTDLDLLDFARTVGATYLVDGPFDHGFIARFHLRNPQAAVVVFDNGTHRLLRLRESADA